MNFFDIQNLFFRQCFIRLLIGLSVVMSANNLWAQGDAVYRFRPDGGSTKINGKISGTTPYAVTIQASNGTQEIPANEIKELVFNGEPLEVGRARDRLTTGRFADVQEELGKIKDPIKTPGLQQEIDFLSAAANSEMSLRTGNIPAPDAGREMNTFLKNNPNSVHVYPATKLLGQLLMAVGKADLAQAEFAKLTESQWPVLVVEGHFLRGEALLADGKYPDADAEYRAIEALTANDELTSTYKLLATVRLAKSQAMQGQTDAAIKAIEEVIKVENPDNSKLFSYTYNSLGSAQLQAGNIKEAVTAFLHTDLLYSNETEPHAEALYHLADLWKELERTDPATQARERLRTRYRNSYWNSILK